MFPEYNPKDIEKAAQDKWLKEGRFKSCLLYTSDAADE